MLIQTFTDDSECCSTIGLQRTQKGPCHTSLYLLALAPVCSSSWCNLLMLAYRTATGSAPAYFHSVITIYIPSRSLRSASERRLVVPSQRGTKSRSRTFSFTVPGWWNELPTPHPEFWVPDNFQATPENSSHPSSLDFCFFIIKN